MERLLLPKFFGHEFYGARFWFGSCCIRSQNHRTLDRRNSYRRNHVTCRLKNQLAGYQAIAKKICKRNALWNALRQSAGRRFGQLEQHTQLAAHQEATKADASTMVEYILLLAQWKWKQGLSFAGVVGVRPCAKRRESGRAHISSVHSTMIILLEQLHHCRVRLHSCWKPCVVWREHEWSECCDNLRHARWFKVLMNIVAETRPPSKCGCDECKIDEHHDRWDGTDEEWSGRNLSGFKNRQEVGYDVDFTKSPKIPIQAGIDMRRGRYHLMCWVASHNIVLVFVNPNATADDKLYIFSRLILGNWSLNLKQHWYETAELLFKALHW